MSQKNYESVVIINATLDDEQINSIVKTIQSLITDNGGEINEVDVWGRKRLAYPIEKAKSGFYVVYRFTSNPEFISKLERMYRLDENVIRFITIALDKHALAYYEKIKEEKANQQEVVEETKNEEYEEIKETELLNEQTNESVNN